MIRVTEFEGAFATLLPETYALLKTSNLVVHEKVAQVTLHGSRGLAGGCRPDSDIDVSLIVDLGVGSGSIDLELSLREVLETTLTQWRGPLRADVAVVFDVRGCGLDCFQHQNWDERLCAQGGVDCFGLYKRIDGQPGFMIHAGVQVKRMYPCLTIFRSRHFPGGGESQTRQHLAAAERARPEPQKQKVNDPQDQSQ